MQYKDTQTGAISRAIFHHLISVVVSSEHFLNPGCDVSTNCGGLISARLRGKMMCAMFAGGAESARPEERLVLTEPD